MTDWFARVAETVAENERRDPDFYRDPDAPKAESAWSYPSMGTTSIGARRPELGSNLAINPAAFQNYVAVAYAAKQMPGYYFGHSNSAFSPTYYGMNRSEWMTANEIRRAYGRTEL